MVSVALVMCVVAVGARRVVILVGTGVVAVVVGVAALVHFAAVVVEGVLRRAVHRLVLLHHFALLLHHLVEADVVEH